jgi:hypothetical protein
MVSVREKEMESECMRVNDQRRGSEVEVAW